MNEEELKALGEEVKNFDIDKISTGSPKKYSLTRSQIIKLCKSLKK